YDNHGDVVFTMVASAGDPVSRNVYLPKGNYTVRFAAATRSGSPLPPLAVTLRGTPLGDPIGPQTSDPTADPAGGDLFDTSDCGFWQALTNSGNVPLVDPYSDPYAPF